MQGQLARAFGALRLRLTILLEFAALLEAALHNGVSTQLFIEANVFLEFLL